ncbi:hypothetical protein NCCP2222_27370 [Sporosarcina sp. NCCP-2222]|uniref:hypothetical protein n=1 Tax=Sporosarcina sp. NCCP-2222 TaxID=2935073 RepID=UPI00208AA39C|nr:hypothetical protein [Sporosarcina sp. NCCP-2222]GKV56790.1 hypothetical protein NCCP2222_27370 [Sporosarcina sp. NCCP-2222]
MFISALNDRNFNMQIRDTNQTGGDGWKRVWGKEAAAANPLAAVNQGRNSLIMDSIRKNDWSAYHQFEAKQHPAWYDKVNGEFKPNKLYYGNLLDVQNRSLKEAMQSGDQQEIANRQARMEELIADFKNAPGEVPHVITFATDPELAQKHGIQKPSSDWYNSPYNSDLAASQGRFQDQYWYENPYFADHPNEMTFAMEAVQELRPDIAKIAASINKGAYERNVASSSFSSSASKTAQPATETEVTEVTDSDETTDTSATQSSKAFTQAAEQFSHQFSADGWIATLFSEKEQTVNNSYDVLLDQLTRKAEERRATIG